MTREEIIKAERENGATYVELAKKYDISPERVRQICTHRNIAAGSSFYPDFKDYGTDAVNLCLKLRRAGINTKEQIIEMAKSGELMKVRNIGKKSFRIICEVYKDSLATLIPKEVTHGDVFMKMFKKAFPKTILIFKCDENNSTISICFSREWWDEPYDAEHYAKVRRESEAAEQ